LYGEVGGFILIAPNGVTIESTRTAMSAPQSTVSSHCHVGGRVAVSKLADGSIAVRYDKVDGGPVLTFTSEEWHAFVAGVKNAEFDLSAPG
jgi:hypothetical protein